jgi:hypothetical protein
MKSLALAMFLIALAASPVRAATPQSLRERVDADVVAGRPIVVHVVVPLCEQSIIHCGNDRLGDGERPDRNLYWNTSGGFRGWFGRKSSGWSQVLLDKPGGEVLERRVWRRRVVRQLESGRRKTATVYVVADAWRGKSITDAIDHYAASLLGTHAVKVELEDGTILQAGGAAHVVGYVGHNGWMDIPPYDWKGRIARHRSEKSPAKGAIAVACISAPYVAGAFDASHVEPLLMTTSLMFAGAHSFEGAVNAFARGAGLAQVRHEAAANHAAGQGKRLKQVIGMFTNPASKSWRRATAR